MSSSCLLRARYLDDDGSVAFGRDRRYTPESSWIGFDAISIGFRLCLGLAAVSGGRGAEDRQSEEGLGIGGRQIGGAAYGGAMPF